MVISMERIYGERSSMVPHYILASHAVSFCPSSNLSLLLLRTRRGIYLATLKIAAVNDQSIKYKNLLDTMMSRYIEERRKLEYPRDAMIYIMLL